MGGCEDGPPLLTEADVVRLLPAEQAALVVGPAIPRPYVARMPTQPDGRCAHARSWGCAVHARKPEDCARWLADGCTLYQPDPRKLSGEIVLGVPCDE